MRLIPLIFSLLLSSEAWAARSVLEGKNGECGVSESVLRQGNISITQIPCIVLNVTNNMLSYVGYISLGVLLFGALYYIIGGGMNEELKSKGKEAMKMALWGAVVSWSAWIIVNLVLDNITNT